MVTSEIRTFCQNHCYNFPRLLTKEIQLSFDKRKCNYYGINEYIVFYCLLIYTWQITLRIVGFWHNYFPTWRHCNFPFRKHARPFTKHLQIFLYLFKEKGKYVSNHLASNLEPLFPNIPLIPLHCQDHPPNFRRIYKMRLS